MARRPASDDPRRYVLWHLSAMHSDRILELSDSAFRLFAMGLLKGGADQREGEVPTKPIRLCRFSGLTDTDVAAEARDELFEAGLWEETEDDSTAQIAGWSKYQFQLDDVKADRVSDSARKRESRTAERVAVMEGAGLTPVEDFPGDRRSEWTCACVSCGAAVVTSLRDVEEKTFTGCSACVAPQTAEEESSGLPSKTELRDAIVEACRAGDGSYKHFQGMLVEAETFATEAAEAGIKDSHGFLKQAVIAEALASLFDGRIPAKDLPQYFRSCKKLGYEPVLWAIEECSTKTGLHEGKESRYILKVADSKAAELRGVA